MSLGFFCFEPGESMFAKAARLYRCVRHVPCVQLLRRLQLNATRRVMMSRVGHRMFSRRPPAISPAAFPPKAVFPPRRHLAVMKGGQWFLRQLNCEFSLQTPVDWALKNQSHTHLQRLAMHYHEFLETVPAEEGMAIIHDWRIANPPWQPRYWLDSWNSYAVSIRCVCWMQWWTQHADCMTSSDRIAVLESLILQIQFLTQNLETDICGNHLIRNIRCLLWASAFFEGAEAAAWHQLGVRLLREQLAVQFLPDGMHFELSPAYHCQVFGDLIDCVSVLSGSIREVLLEQLQKAARVIADLTHPDTLISLMSDGGLHMAYTPRECLEAFVRVGGRLPETRGHFSLDSSGYYGLRTQVSYLIVDCGPACDDVLPAHGHADILSFEWDAGGQRFIVDAGVFEYEAGNRRLQDRSVISHNTVSVGDRDQCEFVGSFRTGRRGYGKCDRVEISGQQFHLVGHHRAFATDSRAIVHRRSFDADSQHLRINDTIEGSGGERVTSRLLLHHECRIERVDETTLHLSRAGTVIQLKSKSPVRLCEGGWSPDFGVFHKTVCIELDYGRVPCQSEFELEILSSSELRQNQ